VPAAKSMHHTEFGGCLAHCALVALNAFRVAQIYNSVYSKERPFLDIELVITGSLIHDMGKVVEFEWDALEGAMDYSNNIDSVDTHITLIGEWLTEIAIANGFKDNESYRLLRHCVLSHHGLLEFGSPVVPAIPEAYIISVCDKMDANIWGYSNSMSDLECGESKYCRVGGELKRIYNRK
jgi:3'-5' exoribonuclease